MALADFPIPGLHFFVSKNSFCGSHGSLNYRVTPVFSDDSEDAAPHLEVYTWYGMLCSDLSERQAESSFPMDEEGLQAVVAWLREQDAVCRTGEEI